MGSCESKSADKKKKIGKRWADLRKLQWQRQRLLYFLWWQLCQALNEPFEVAMIMEQAFACTEFSYIDLAQSKYVEVTKEEDNEEPVYTLSEEFYSIPR